MKFFMHRPTFLVSANADDTEMKHIKARLETPKVDGTIDAAISVVTEPHRRGDVVTGIRVLLEITSEVYLVTDDPYFFTAGVLPVDKIIGVGAARGYGVDPALRADPTLNYWKISAVGRFMAVSGREATEADRIVAALAVCPKAAVLGKCPGILDMKALREEILTRFLIAAAEERFLDIGTVPSNIDTYRKMMELDLDKLAKMEVNVANIDGMGDYEWIHDKDNELYCSELTAMASGMPIVTMFKPGLAPYLRAELSDPYIEKSNLPLIRHHILKPIDAAYIAKIESDHESLTRRAV